MKNISNIPSRVRGVLEKERLTISESHHPDFLIYKAIEHQPLTANN